MAWAQEPATEASIGTFLAQAVADFDDGSNFNYAIVERDETAQSERIVGGCGLHKRLVEPGPIEIGYWVHVDHVRRGIATAAAVALRQEASSMGIGRVKIHCDESNAVSAAVARRAGFELVRTDHRPARTPSESDREMIWRSDSAAD